MPRFANPTKIQTVIVKRRKGLTKREASSMISKAGFNVLKIDTRPTQYRFRQKPPSAFNPDTFRTIKLNSRLNAVIGVPKI